MSHHRTTTRLVARACVGLLAVVGIGAGLSACEPADTCPNTITKYADKPVKDISRANAEKAIVCLANQQRAANGLTAYKTSSILTGTAKKHGQDAVIRKWWTDGADPHTNPDGKGPGDRIQDAGYCPNPTLWAAGENVYWGWGTSSSPTARQAMTWWMNSPGHRANILNSDYRDIGVGVIIGAPRPGDYPNAAVFVQNFGFCNN